MADMIFPTQRTEDSLGKIKTLDANFIAERLASLREAGDGSKMPAELLEHFKSKNYGADKASDKDDKDEEDGKDDEDEEDGGEECDEDEETDGEMIKRALAEMDELATGSAGIPSGGRSARKIVFTDADLTAEAVQKDVVAGNQEMAGARLAARQMRRERLATRIASTAEAQVVHAQRLASRSDFRKQIVSEVESSLRKITASKAPAAQIVAKSSYKSGSEIAKTERQIIAKRLAAAGEFPAEFIDAALHSGRRRSAVEEVGREIMASDLSSGAKRIAIRQIVANLTPESRNRAIEYWTKDLGYGDKDWVKDLFSDKYDKTKSRE